MMKSRPGPGWEIAAIAILTAIGGTIRLLGTGRLGLTHFDEGVYALSGLWIYGPKGVAGLDPSLIAYAPPGVPILVGLAYYLGQGPSDTAAISVSLIAGILTIPVVAWVGRRTFGPGSGAATAAFSALSGPHVAFSRSALTDATFLLGWLLAIGLGGRFLERPRFGRALAFGVAVGLTQNVKYHGWIAGAIVALAAWPVVHRPRRQILLTLLYCLLATVAAALLYLPWFLLIEKHGGYAGLMAHQQKYFGGIEHWLPHLRMQLAQAVALSGGPAWGATASLLAWSGSALAGGTCPAGSRNRRALWVYVLGLPTFTLMLSNFPECQWWVSLVAAPWLGREPYRAARGVVAVGFLTLTILIPFYHPYARLWLPIHAFGWMIMGGLLPRVVPTVLDVQELLCARPMRGLPIAWTSLIVFLLLHEILTSPRPKPCPGLLEPTDELRTKLADGHFFVREISRTPSRTLQVLARPATVFYLSGRVGIRTFSGLSGLRERRHDRECMLIDEGLLSPDEVSARSWRQLGRGSGYWKRSGIRVSLPTGLDEDPRLPFAGLTVRPSFYLDFLDEAPPDPAEAR